MKNPKYTFLLPAYKGRFLEEMLRSIQSQTYKDFKVIISDDCSPEDLYSICKPYLDDSRFSYRRNEKNMGREDLVSHWNLLVDMCDTDYLILASDDDVYDTNFLEEVNKLSTKYPQVDLIHGRANIIDKDGIVIQQDAIYEEYTSQIEYMTFIGFLSHVECIANYCYKTDVIKKIGGFVDYPLAWGSDTMTNNIMAHNGVCNTPCVVFNFRVSDINITNESKYHIDTAEKKIKASILFSNRLQELWPSVRTSNDVKSKRVLDMAHFLQERVGISNFITYCSALPLRSFLCFYSFFSHNPYFTRQDRFLVIKKWIYYRLTGK